MKTVIEMAQESGFQVDRGALLRIYLEDFAELVRADAIAEEREACAGLRKEIELRGKWPSDYEDGFFCALEKYEDMIRARGNNDT